MARFWSPRQAQKDEVDALSEQLVTVLDPAAVASEAYRSLRTTLLYAAANTPPTVILITSPGLSGWQEHHLCEPGSGSSASG